MVVRCPACQSRREIPTVAPGMSAVLVDCRGCGHEWVESIGAKQQAARPEAGALPAARGERDTRLLLEAARRARVDFKRERRARLLRLAAWAGLALLALSPPVAALAFPEQVVAVFPATLPLYAQFGREVSLYGLDLRGLEVQHLFIDGQGAIVVTGKIANTSRMERRVPMLRLALRGDHDGEVYHSVLDTETKPLKPGESTSFRTRLPAPPEAARNLEIRFARADEIGSNAAHE